jgi:hypothetical protein
VAGGANRPPRKEKFGGLPPRYGFILNPYPDQRVSHCPLCERRTRQRKTPLLVHVDPHHFFALNYACRYCKECDLIIAHKTEIEHLLTELFRHHDAGVIGNDYLIIGTVETNVWREGLSHHKTLAEMLPHASDFATYYEELRSTRPGYYRADQEPAVVAPPASQEWVKRGLGVQRGSGVITGN